LKNLTAVAVNPMISTSSSAAAKSEGKKRFGLFSGKTVG